MKSSLKFRAYCRRVVAALFVAALASGSSAAVAEYKLQPGDVLDISVMAVPGLKQRAVIGLEGEVSLPLVGMMKVSGLTIEEAASKIAQRLANKVYRPTGGEGADGSDTAHLIVPDEVVVTVAEFHPIYVSGDVAKPGEYAFRPGMTVRQAIAVAGGYSLIRLGTTDPYLQSADLAAEYETLSAQLATEQALGWRLRAELSAPDAVKPAASEGPAPPAGAQHFMQGENQQLEAWRADREQDAAFFATAISKADLQLKALAEKKKEGEAGYAADYADFEKLKQLLAKGLTTANRLGEARRVALLSSTNLLQTIIDISNIERQRGDYVRQLDKLRSQSRIDVLKELQSTELRIAETTARLKSVREKMTYVGLTIAPPADGKVSRPSVTVHRVSDNRAEDLTAADDNLQLLPGDTVEVTMPKGGVVRSAPPANGQVSMAK